MPPLVTLYLIAPFNNVHFQTSQAATLKSNFSHETKFRNFTSSTKWRSPIFAHFRVDGICHFLLIILRRERIIVN